MGRCPALCRGACFSSCRTVGLHRVCGIRTSPKPHALLKRLYEAVYELKSISILLVACFRGVATALPGGVLGPRWNDTTPPSGGRGGRLAHEVRHGGHGGHGDLIECFIVFILPGW